MRSRTDPAHNLCRFDADVEAAIERTFDTLRRHALPLGLPIMLTEYGAESKPLPDGARNDADNAQWAGQSHIPCKVHFGCE